MILRGKRYNVFLIFIRKVYQYSWMPFTAQSSILGLYTVFFNIEDRIIKYPDPVKQFLKLHGFKHMLETLLSQDVWYFVNLKGETELMVQIR